MPDPVQTPVQKYELSQAMGRPQMTWPPVIAGEASALIHDIPTAGEIVQRIVVDAERLVLRHRGDAG
jgi:hypothetical protein